MISPTAAKSYAKTSCRRKTARSFGDSASSTTRKARESVSKSAAVSAMSGAAPASGSGNQGPTYCSRLARAEPSWSRQTLLIVVVNHPFGVWIATPSCRVRCQRRYVSCTASSASVALPSMR